MANWVIEALGDQHQRAGFCCGKPSLDDFLHKLVNQYEKRNLGRTFVLFEPPDLRVLGYYTLASSSVAFENLPKTKSKKLPKHPAPVVLLGRLAVDESRRGEGLGAALLVDALRRSVLLSQELGVHAVEVRALDEAAKAFYEHFGFVPLEDDPLHLFLPISELQKQFHASS